ncbi:MAG: redoxin domain-containing protein, partial [Actinobacteria bacterium]|nr:redoxin domain-containing protein [Actinomycetota bacterium]
MQRRGWRKMVDVRVGVAVLVLALAVALAATRFSFLQGAAPLGGAGSRPAPALTGIDAWINSPPLQLDQLRGHVVWVDFWTYSCINCLRTLPFVKSMYARYHGAGLDIVGIHSPEFDFEKVESNVRAAVARYSLPYPVALDNEMTMWRAYRNNEWPHVY